MVLTVRPARPDDAAAAADVLNAIIEQGGTTALETPLSPAEVQEWFLAGPKVWCCHVAEAEGRLIGFQSVGRFGDLPEGWGEMATYARIGQTRSGIGSALFAHTTQAARVLGVKHLNALIRSDNVGGLAYYTRVGFGADQAGASATLKSGAVIARIAKRFDL